MKKIFLVLVLFLNLVLFSRVSAAYPVNLSMVGLGDGASVRVIVNGSPLRRIMLYYKKIDSGVESYYLGMTDLDGKYSTTLNSKNLMAEPNGKAHVIVDNEQSESINWPYITSSNPNADGQPMKADRNMISLKIGELMDVKIAGGYMPYNASVNGNNVWLSMANDILTVTGMNQGSSLVSICSAKTDCLNLMANVSGTSTPVISNKITPNGQIVTLAVVFLENNLYRDQKGKIFLIKNNKKQYIKNLAELKKYKGKKIINVMDSAINQIPSA